ncbi:GNAT family N-acetyltransferase [Marinomonas sp. THO17]|uniref:GNAT family N-acetyltransferase n=1 Tax=Marinomonas sp. THO17 TaxID=3149048 RepID=UPI00336BD723
MATVIRRAELTDTKAVTDCVKAAFEHYIERIGRPPGPMMEDYYRVIYQHRVFVILVDDDLVGVLVLKERESSMLLDNIAIRPDQQGKGYGMQLLNLAEIEALKAEFPRLTLSTHVNMHESIQLYQSLGYVETERKNNDGYQRVFMKKDLLSLKAT